MIRTMKILMIVTILCLTVFNSKRIIEGGYFVTYGLSFDPEARLVGMVNSVIGIPSYQKPQFKNNKADIKQLSLKEWLRIQNIHKVIDVDLVEDELNSVAYLPTVSEAEHFMSLAIDYGNNRSCVNYLPCKVMTLVVNDYVTEQPEILENIIKVAKRPCDYIIDLQEINPEGEVVFVRKFGFRGLKVHTVKYKSADIKELINAARMSFQCDRKSFWEGGGIKSLSVFNKEYVDIVIRKRTADKSNKNLTIISVKREDI